MKKVLIIANLFHASPRIPTVSKYLSEFGWEPIILTGPIDKDSYRQSGFFGFSQDFIKSEVKIIEAPYFDVLNYWKGVFGFHSGESVRREVEKRTSTSFVKFSISPLLYFLREIITYPDKEKNWKFPAIKAVEEFLQKEKVDAIISSSSPVTSHIIAKELKSKYRIPWIADLRDLWTQNHNYHHGWIRKLFEKRLELKTLLSADALVTVSPPWTKKLRFLHKRNETYTITNGFDPAKVNIPPANLISKFTITYTGQIYTGKQDPSKLLTALKDLISNGTINISNIEVRFYGPENESLGREIKAYGLSAIVKQYGVIPREISFERQRESHVLLLLNWNDEQGKGWYPLKVFEYLAAQRPILAIGGSGDDVVKKLLDETKAGVYCKDIGDIKSSLRRFYLEYKQEKKVSYRGDVKEINKYSYREMAKNFAEILNSLENNKRRY